MSVGPDTTSVTAADAARQEGRRDVYAEILRLAIKGLADGSEDRDRVALLIERSDTISMLRRVCASFGDNYWPDSLHLADIIEKHLERHLYDEVAPRCTYIHHDGIRCVLAEHEGDVEHQAAIADVIRVYGNPSYSADETPARTRCCLALDAVSEGWQRNCRFCGAAHVECNVATYLASGDTVEGVKLFGACCSECKQSAKPVKTAHSVSPEVSSHPWLVCREHPTGGKA